MASLNKTESWKVGLTVVFALVTASIHLFLGIRDLSSFLGILFVLNSLGFLGLTLMLFLPFLAKYREWVRWGLAAFSALTFVLYFVMNGPHIDLVSGLAKGAEIGIILSLLLNRKGVHHPEK